MRKLGAPRIPMLFALLTLLLLQVVAAAAGNGPHLQERADNCKNCRADQECWSGKPYTCHDVTTVTTTRLVTITGPLTQVVTVVPGVETITQWTTVTVTTTSLPGSAGASLARRQNQGSLVTRTKTTTSYIKIGTTLFRITTTRPASSNASPSTTTTLATSTVWELPSATPTADSSAAASSSGGGKRTNAGAVAGGILGGLVGVALLLVGALWWLRRKHRAKDEMAEKPVAPVVPQDDESEINMRSMSPQQRTSSPIPSFPLPPALGVPTTKERPRTVAGISSPASLSLTRVSPRLSLDGGQFRVNSTSPPPASVSPVSPIEPAGMGASGDRVRRKPAPIRTDLGR